MEIGNNEDIHKNRVLEIRKVSILVLFIIDLESIQIENIGIDNICDDVMILKIVEEIDNH